MDQSNKRKQCDERSFVTKKIKIEDGTSETCKEKKKRSRCRVRETLQQSNERTRQRYRQEHKRRLDQMTANRARAVSPDKREILQYISGDEEDFDIIVYDISPMDYSDFSRSPEIDENFQEEEERHMIRSQSTRRMTIA